VLDYLVSDHSPCVPELKRLESGDFLEAWGGIASLQLGLAIASTLAALDFSEIARLMCRRPAEVARLADRKGAIAVGLDADFAVFDPDASFVVRGAELAQRHPITPYEGRTLKGRVLTTYLRGQVVFESGRILDEPRGRLLRATST
jgi:allantoinase